MSAVSQILVTIPAKPHHRELLESAAPNAAFTYLPQAEVTAEVLEKAEVVLGNLPPEMFKNAKNLKFLQLNSAGSDIYAAAGVLPEGVVLANATGSYGLAISEYLIAVLFSLSKKLPRYRDRQRANCWKDLGEVKPIQGTTVLVVGLGDIGGEFAKRVKAMGAHVIGVRRKGTEKPDFVDELYLNEKLDELIPEADTIALCLPNTPDTVGIMNRERIFNMKQDAILLNIGRGSAVDADALCDALDEGRLWGAALDVFPVEPLPAESRMWQTENLLMTPHTSGQFSLPETLERIVRLMAENLGNFINDRPVKNIVDSATGYRKL